MKWRVYLLFFFALLSVMSTAHAHAGESMAASVRLNVRSGPGLDNPVLDTLRVGERVLVNHCRSDWCQITHVGIDGWVFAPYLIAATFTQTWRATSRGLSPTLHNDNATALGIDVGIDTSHRCPANYPQC